MMNKIKSSNLAKLKVFAIIPVLTVLFLAFSIDKSTLQAKAKVEGVNKIMVVEDENKVEEDTTVHVLVEEMPVFPGGDLALRKFIAVNVKYPAEARSNDIQGKVFIRFVVSTDGSVKDLSIARGVDKLLDDEAIRVVSMLPKWKPGKQDGKPVNVWYTIPINFAIQ